MADPFDPDTEQTANPFDRPDLEDIDYQEHYDRPEGMDQSDSQATSQFGLIAENARLHGVSPGPDEYDTREIYDGDDAAEAIAEIIDTLASRVAPDGSPIAEDRAELLWGMVHVLDSQSRNLQNQINRDINEAEELRYAEGVNEMNDETLSRVLDRIVAYNDRSDAFAHLRRVASSKYREHTGETWRARRRTDIGAASPRINMRDYDKSRTWRDQRDGIRIAVTGSREAPSREAVWAALDDLQRRHGRELVIVHGGHKEGIDAIAAAWAAERDVRTAVYRPEFKDKRGNRIEPHIALARRNRLIVKDGLSAALTFSPARVAHSSDLVVLSRNANIPVEIVRPGANRADRLSASQNSLAEYRPEPIAPHARAVSHPSEVADAEAAIRNTRQDRRNTHFDPGDVTNAMHDAADALTQRITPEGYQLEDQRESLLWGFVNVFNEQTKRLERAIRDMSRNTDIPPEDREEAVNGLRDRLHSFEELHSQAGSLYFEETRRVWESRAGHRYPKLTSAKIEFEAYVQNRDRALHAAQAPDGTIIAVHGDKIEGNIERFHYDQIAAQLDQLREKHGHVLVAHGGYSQGVDKLVAMWAENRGVPQIPCPPNYSRFKNSNNPAARAAFERNRDMFRKLDIKELVLFGEANRGTAANMLELAKETNTHQENRNPDRTHEPRGIEITSIRFDPAMPQRTDINDRYSELLQAAGQNPQLIPYQNKFEGFHDLIGEAIASRDQPPAYTGKLIELDQRLRTDMERGQTVAAIQNDIVDLSYQHSRIQQESAADGLMETTEHYPAFVEDCTNCLQRWNALQADPDMKPHLEQLAVDHLDARVETLSQYARYPDTTASEQTQLHEPPPAQVQHPIVREYTSLLESAGGNAELIPYQEGYETFRDDVRATVAREQETPNMQTALNRLLGQLAESETHRSNVESVLQRLSVSSATAHSLETWAEDHPDQPIHKAPSFKAWRTKTDETLDLLKTMQRRPELRPHLQDQPATSEWIERRISYLTEQRFQAPSRPDPTQQQARQAQRQREARQQQSRGMGA